MTWNARANQLFLRAAELESAADQQDFLDRECAGDAALRDEVAALLSAASDVGSFLQSPLDFPSQTILRNESRPGDLATFPSSDPVDAAATSPREDAPRVIGPYRLLEKLGEGGMGVVYLAEQSQPVKRQVALKIIKPGMDTAQVVARFEVERQALAIMDHPQIARVFDAGTTDTGRPFFVMELVKGLPITRYCDTSQLSLRERLQLFVPVCKAIQHAHQRGIIHRDIKPSNVLIAVYDGQPVPKVIDFGIAKATYERFTERAIFTEVGQIVGTLEYMSPEQAEMNQLDVDTRSDVYSLGVLLYELLTGTTPITREQLRRVGFVEMLRTIRELEPPRPSTRLSESGDALASISAVRRTEPRQLSHLVRGDLDWIVMKALEKDRARRYETPNQLGADIERFLNDEVVEASPPGASYRVRKLIRKHRGKLATATVLLTVLFVSAVVSTWQAIRATKAEQVARKNEKAATANEEKALAYAVAEQQARLAEAAQRTLAELSQREALAERDAKEQALVARTSAEQRSLAALNDSQRMSARFALAQGQALAENGDGGGLPDVSSGMLWMAKSLRLAPPDDAELSQLARLRLSRWATSSVGIAAVYTNQSSDEGSPFLLVRGGRAFAMSGCQRPGLAITDIASGRRDEPPVELQDKVHSAMAANLQGTVMVVRMQHDAQEAQFWDTATVQPLSPSFRLPSRIVLSAFAPDGQTVWIIAEDGVYCVSVAAAIISGQPLRPAETPRSIAISPDGETLLAVEDKRRQLTFWSTSSREQSAPALVLESPDTSSITVSRDGRWFATCSQAAADVGDLPGRCWTGRRVQFGARGYGIGFSPDGESFAVGCEDRLLYRWRTSTLESIGQPIRHPRWVFNICFPVDGRQFLTSCRDDVVRLWNSPDPPKARRLPDTNAGLVPPPMVGLPWFDDFRGEMSLPINPERDEFMAVGRFPTVRCQRLSTGEAFGPTFDHGSVVIAAALSPDGKLLMTGGLDGKARLWNRLTGQPVGSALNHHRPPLGIAFGSKSDTVLLTCSWAHEASRDSRMARLWNLVDGAVVGDPAEFGHNVWGVGNRTVDLSPDGTRCLSAGWGRTDVFDTRTRQQVSGPFYSGRWVRVARFSPDGKTLLVGGEDHFAQLWNVETGEAASLPLAHHAWVESADFSPSGRTLATSKINRVIRIWDVATSKQIGPDIRHDVRCAAIRFIDEHQLLILDYNDRIWRLPLPGPVEGSNDEVRAWVEFRAGQELRDSGTISPLTEDQLKERWERCGPLQNFIVKPQSELDPTLARVQIDAVEYGQMVQAAFQEQTNGGSGPACGVLETSERFARGWEYRYVQRVANPGKLEFRGHSDGLWSAQFNRDESQMVTGSADRTAIIWDVRTGQPIRRLVGHISDVSFALFSPDGQRIVTCSGKEDRSAKVWDANSGAELLTLRGHTSWIVAASFSPDGTQVVTASGDGTAKIWNSQSGAEILTLNRPESPVNSCDYHPDGSKIVTGNHDGTIVLWNARDATLLRIIKGHSGQVRATRFNGDGTRVVSASLDGTAKVWDPLTGNELLRLRDADAGPVWSANWSRDGARIVTGSQHGLVNLWDVVNGTQLQSTRGHTRIVHSAELNSNGTRILTASADRVSKLFDTTTPAGIAALLGHQHLVTSAAFDPSASRIVTTSRDKTAKIWDSETRACRMTLEGHTDDVTSAAFTSDGSAVVTGSEDMSARLWDTTTGNVVAVLKGHTAGVKSVAFSPKEELAVTASYDHTARVWVPREGREKLKLTGHTDGVRSAVFSRDGTQVLTASADRTARLWELATGLEILVLRGHGAGIWKADFNSDGTRIITASADMTCRIWDARTGQELLTLRGHTNDVYAAAFSPTESRIATAGLDGNLILWDATTGTPLLTLNEPVSWPVDVRFSPDGETILTALSDGTARLWQATPPAAQPVPAD